MNQQNQSQSVETIGATDFMTPEQRRREIAQILATVGLRILSTEQQPETERNMKGQI